MSEEKQFFTGTATAETSELAMQRAHEIAASEMKKALPDFQGEAVGSFGAANNPDGTFTAYVSLSPVTDEDRREAEEFKRKFPDPAAFKFPTKGEIRRRLHLILSPVLEPKGFKYLKTKDTFVRQNGTQTQSIRIGTAGSGCQFSTDIKCSEIAKFYRSFRTDPRQYAHWWAYGGYFPDWQHFGFVPDLPPYESDPFDAKAPVIVAFLNETILPWFEKYPSLESIKTAQELHCDNDVKHETLLALYFLLDDSAGLDKYLTWIANRDTNQPSLDTFTIFYEFLHEKHPQFFPPLANYLGAAK